MKTIAFAAIAMLVAAPAFAGEKGDWDAKMEASFKQIDADASGEVTEAEYLAYKQAAYAKKGKTMDAAEVSTYFAEMSGGDGALTLAEMKSAYKAEKKREKSS